MLRVHEPDGRNVHGKRLWRCTCDCGKECRKTTQAFHGKHPSCGCEASRRKREARLRHGHGGTVTTRPTVEYNTLMRIRARCNHPGDPHYADYGGRGIRVCPRWGGPDGFQNFLADMGPRPVGTSIERVDNDGPYSPGNCIWATRKVQSRNKRTSHRLTYKGETLTIAGWAERTGLKANTLQARIAAGWDVEVAITTPTRTRGGRPNQ